MRLNRVNSAIDRTERNKINENFDILERGYGKSFQDSQTSKEQSDYAVATSDEAKAIAEGIDDKATQALQNSSDAVVTSVEAMDLAESVQTQFNQVVIQGDSSVEAAQARVDADNKVYDTLKARLDAENERVNQQFAQIEVSIERFGAIADDGATDNSTFIQAAIDYVYEKGGGTVFIPKGVYGCANVLLKSKVNIRGNGYESVLKLLPDVSSRSINGSLIDNNGYYPSNVLATTTTHTGDTQYSTTRAYITDNDEYIVSNVTISNLLIDGNKAENTLGDLGGNASAMGACISLNQASHITVRDCKLINARLDGLFLGYTLHGGSDYCLIENCEFEDHVRTSVAQVTGKFNTFRNLKINNPTATMAAFDIEANDTNEVNYAHIVENCHIIGRVALVAKLAANQRNIKFINNYVKGNIELSNAKLTEGTIIKNNTFEGDYSETLLNIGGEHFTDDDISLSPIIFEGNVCKGYKEIIPSISLGGHGYINFVNNHVVASSGFDLIRPSKINITNNTFEFLNGMGVNERFLNYFCGQIATIPNQGQIIVEGNVIKGDGLHSLIGSNLGADSLPNSKTPFVTLSNNNIDVSISSDTMISSDLSIVVANNTIKNMALINAVDYMKINNNSLDFGDVNKPLLFAVRTLKNVELIGNIIRGGSISLARPHKTMVKNNVVIDGNINVTYSFTSDGVGENIIDGNVLQSTASTIDYAIQFSTGGGYDVANFTGDDIISNNMHMGLFNSGYVAADELPVRLVNNSFAKVKSTLPVASEFWRGQVTSMLVNNVDTPHICIFNGTTYEWKKLSTTA